MKTAFSVWNDRISPVFDASRHFLVLDIDDGKVLSRTEAEIPDPNPWRKLDKLIEMNVRALVCGAISRPLAERADGLGIDTVPFIAGGLNEVIAAYLEGKLPNSSLTMPGCCPRREGGERRCRRLGSHGAERHEAGQAPTKERSRTMPQGDGTGPLGQGPGTGRGTGRCGKGQPSAGKPGGGQGQGQGQGRGRGRGGAGKGNKQG